MTRAILKAMRDAALNEGSNISKANMGRVGTPEFWFYHANAELFIHLSTVFQAGLCAAIMNEESK